MKKHIILKLTELEFDALFSVVNNKLYFDNVDDCIDDIKENQSLERIMKKLKKQIQFNNNK